MNAKQTENKTYSYLFNKTRRSLLALFYSNPDQSFYVNDILLKLHRGSGSVQRELKMMAAAGLVVRKKKGIQVFYRANKINPIFKELSGIVRKTSTKQP